MEETLMEQIPEILIQGGIAAVDAFSFFILHKESRFYLTFTPNERDYSFVPQKQLNSRIEAEVKKLRKIGKWLLISSVPVAVTSLIIVGLTIAL